MKKLVLIVIGVFVLGFIFIGMGSNKSDTKTTGTENNSTKTEQTDKQKDSKKDSNEGQVGSPLVFDKEAEITIKNAVWTDERNVVVDKQAKKVLLVTYDVKNLKDKDYVVGTELNLYVNGKKAESYPIHVTMETISAGRVLEGATQAFAVNEDGPLELEVKPAMSWKNDKKIVKLDLK